MTVLCLYVALSFKKVKKGVRIFAWLCHASPRPRRAKAPAPFSRPRPALKRGGSPVKPRVTIDPGAVRTPRVERSRSPDQDRKDPGREPWLSNPVVAEPVPAVPEQESCCARLLRWLPRTVRCSVNASIDLGDADVS